MILTINEIKDSIKELENKIDFLQYRLDNNLQCYSCKSEAENVIDGLMKERHQLELSLKVENHNQLFLDFIIAECKECYNNIYFNDDYEIVEGEKYCQDCYDDKFVLCADCQEVLEKDGDIYYNDDNEIICESCYDGTYFYCESCNEIFRLDDSHSTDNGLLCDSCFNENYIICEDCGDTIEHDYSFCNDYYYYCESCYYDNGHSRPDFEEWESEQIDLENNTFNLIPSKKCFGVEIEVSNNDVDFYWIENNTYFGGKYDGSINEGMELYSPILQGDIGYNEIKKVYQEINGSDNDNSAGIHLHIDMRDTVKNENQEYIKNLWFTYLRIENMIYRIIHPRRVRNLYCLKSELQETDILTCDDVMKLYYSNKNKQGTRNFGFNLDSLRYHQTIELRYKDSKLCFDDLINWIKLHLYIFDYVKNNSIDRLKRITSNINSLDRFITFLGIVSKGDYSLINYWIGQYNHYNK